MSMESNNTQRQLVCESCGASFGCYPAPEGGCWCREVKVSDEQLGDLRSKFGDCICPDCLASFISKEKAPTA
jgi:hypothetical protein